MFYDPPKQPAQAGVEHWTRQSRCDDSRGIGCPPDDAATFCVRPSGPFGRIPLSL